MRIPHLTRQAATLELQRNPAIGTFFQAQYGDFLEVPPTVRGLRSFADISAKTRERLMAQAEAHWRYPSLTHHACHELDLLEHRLSTYEEALERRFDVDVQKILRAIKQTATKLLKTYDVSGLLPEDFDPAMEGLPLRLRAGLVTSLIDQSQLIEDSQDPRQRHQALTAWLADIPQMLRGLVCSTPLAINLLTLADLSGLLAKLPLALFTELLPQSTHHAEVYFPSTTTDGTQWHRLNGVVYWHDCLILLDTNCELELRLADAADWVEQLNLLPSMLDQSDASTRFHRYLESSPQIALYDHDHIEFARLRKQDFRQVIRLSVTFNDLLAQMQRLDCVCALNSSRSFALSLHELLCYRDLLRGPMQFMGFLQQRIHASSNPLLGWVAELDHLGMYHRRTNYAGTLSSPFLLRQLVRHSYQEAFEQTLVQRLHDRLSLPFMPPPTRNVWSDSATRTSH